MEIHTAELLIESAGMEWLVLATAQGKVVEDRKYGQKEAQKNGEWLKQKACPFFMLGFVCFVSSTCVGLCVTGRRLIF